MNWVKANKFLTGFIVVLAIGVGILGYEVFAASGAYDDAASAYNTKASEYNRLRSLKPYPNKANLEQFAAQKKTAAEAITAFQVDLAKNEFSLDPMSSEAFQDKLKESVVNVKRKASEKNVKLPDKFFLGFDRYETTPPTPEAAAPLGRQLKAIEWIVNQYIEHSVLEIGPLVREELPEEKAGGQGGPSSKGAGGKGGGGKGSGSGGGRGGRHELVDYHPFEILAICSQANLDDLLNTITGPKAPQFYVLRQIRVKNQNEKGPPKSTPSPTDPAKSKDTQYIVGFENVEALAKIDIVDFNAPSPSDSSAPTEKATPIEKKP